MRYFVYKRILKLASFICIALYMSAVLLVAPARAQTAPQTPSELELPVCNVGACPSELSGAYSAQGESCAANISDFRASPTTSHYWVEDPQITAQGKSNERARQFIYWVFNTRSIDDSPILKNGWIITSNIAYLFVVLVVIVLGVGFIVGQRLQFQTKLSIWPTITKVAGVLLYITFSASLVILLIQTSEILIRFFFENLGGKDFFNIYFSGGAKVGSSEANYLNFIGCRDLNLRVQEGVQTQLFMFKATNITYYVLGSMILLRKILLWFLLFVAPFAGLLIPFRFIRNVAWVWLGVFMQWLFYGPLLGLFLGMTSLIWKQGIPFLFDFSRTNSVAGYIYPTATNITYGGPAQPLPLGVLNNANYVDTFAEYVITLIMLWAAIVLPWWLLRIFRDYCCEYLMAMKNILLSMYDQMRFGAPPTPPTTTAPSQRVRTSISEKHETIQTKRLETTEEIKKAATTDIIRSIDMSATSLSDIAHLETNKTETTNIAKHVEFLQNPMNADSPTDRRRYMTIRTELFNRALKEDPVAKRILSSVSTTPIEQKEHRQTLIRQLQTTATPTQSSAPLKRTITSRTSLTHTTLPSVTQAFLQSVSSSPIVSEIAKTQNMAPANVAHIVNEWYQQIDRTPSEIVKHIISLPEVNTVLTSAVLQDKAIAQTISAQTGVPVPKVEQIVSIYNEYVKLKQGTEDLNTSKYVSEKTGVTRENVETTLESIKKKKIETITNIIRRVHEKTHQDKEMVREIAKKSGASESQVNTLLETQLAVSKTPATTTPGAPVEQKITIPPSVSIEDYEAVKTMWQRHYESADVPVSETIKSRNDWIQNDIVFITNTLNKLTSQEEKMQQEGIDDIGYVLPLFMINNFTASEMLVYLKAKLEAAKAVASSLEKEEDLKDRLAKKSEDLVDILTGKKQEEAKEQTLAAEQELPEENNTK